MCYLVNVDHNGMAEHLTRSDYVNCKKCCIVIAVDKNDDMLRNGSEEDRDVRSGHEEDEGTGCENGTSGNDW